MNPSRESSRRDERAHPPDGHVHRGVALHRSGDAAVRLLARLAQQPVGAADSRNSTARTTIISGPPTNSAAVNCQPINSARITPSSTTRFVEAISKAIAAVKSAPLRNSDRASATAA